MQFYFGVTDKQGNKFGVCGDVENGLKLVPISEFQDIIDNLKSELKLKLEDYCKNFFVPFDLEGDRLFYSSRYFDIQLSHIEHFERVIRANEYYFFNKDQTKRIISYLCINHNFWSTRTISRVNRMFTFDSRFTDAADLGLTSIRQCLDPINFE